MGLSLFTLLHISENIQLTYTLVYIKIYLNHVSIHLFKKVVNFYLWLCWISIAVHGLSLVAASRGYRPVVVCRLLTVGASLAVGLFFFFFFKLFSCSRSQSRIRLYLVVTSLKFSYLVKIKKGFFAKLQHAGFQLLNQGWNSYPLQ